MMRILLLSALFLSSCTHFSPKETAESVFLLTDESGGGTGFLVQAPSGKKYILTNAHVCLSKPSIRTEGHRPAPPTIIEVAEFTDLCLMEAPQHLTRALIVANKEPNQFEKVYIVGYGMLIGSTLSEGTWVGHLNGVVLDVFSPTYSTASVLPGNSGSPVLNEQGKLVGVVFASSAEINNRALMVSLLDIKAFLAIY